MQSTVPALASLNADVNSAATLLLWSLRALDSSSAEGRPPPPQAARRRAIVGTLSVANFFIDDLTFSCIAAEAAIAVVDLCHHWRGGLSSVRRTDSAARVPGGHIRAVTTWPR